VLTGLTQSIVASQFVQDTTQNIPAKQVRDFLMEKFFVQKNLAFYKNSLKLNHTTQEIKLTNDDDNVDNDYNVDYYVKIENFSERENNAVRTIQRFYRRKQLKRHMALKLQKTQDPINANSLSILLSNSIQEKSFSKFSKAYKRFALTEDDLRKLSTETYVYLRTYSKVQFSNTPLEAKIYVFYNKTNANEKKIEVEVIIPITGLYQHIVIPCAQISPHFKKSVFMKKMDEMLIDCLEYDPIYKLVRYNKDGKKNHITGNSKPPQHIYSYIKARLIRMRFLRRRMKTKDLDLLKTEVIKLEKMVLNMNYYWHRVNHELRIVITKAEDFASNREIIIKFDQLSKSSLLKPIVTRQYENKEEFIQEFSPCLAYIAKQIKLTLNKDNASEYKIYADQQSFLVDSVDKKVIVLHYKDISEVENELASSTPKALTTLLSKKKVHKYVEIAKLPSLAQSLATHLKIKDTLFFKDLEKEREIERVANSVEESKSESARNGDQKKNDEKKPVEEELKPLTKEELAKAATVITKYYKGHLARLQLAIYKSMRTKRAKTNSAYGKLVKRTIIKAEQGYYKVTVYKKEINETDTTYFFWATPMREVFNKTGREAKGLYRINKSLLFNSRGKTVEDFLVEKMEIIGANIEFNFNLESPENFGNEFYILIILF